MTAAILPFPPMRQVNPGSPLPSVRIPPLPLMVAMLQRCQRQHPDAWAAWGNRVDPVIVARADTIVQAGERAPCANQIEYFMLCWNLLLKYEPYLDRATRLPYSVEPERAA
jgi:hypothetical protein